jgi:glycosyltransferase involved in cell wall biosynthesis
MSSRNQNLPELDINIPVYNEGTSIVPVLDSFTHQVRTPFRVLICYDTESDNTLPAVRDYPPGAFQLQLVKNQGRGALGAVLTGFAQSTAPAVLMYPADDDYNAAQIDLMAQKLREGCEIVVASRFISGGCMKDCPWLKAALVRSSAFVLHHLARLPTHDPSNGLRLFSRRVLDTIPIESTVGFAYSIELLVKAHRLGWRIGEVPAGWFERRQGKSRFQVLRWVPQYLRWFFYAFATTWFLRGPATVTLRSATQPATNRSP